MERPDCPNPSIAWTILSYIDRRVDHTLNPTNADYHLGTAHLYEWESKKSVASSQEAILRRRILPASTEHSCSEIIGQPVVNFLHRYFSWIDGTAARFSYFQETAMIRTTGHRTEQRAKIVVAWWATAQHQFGHAKLIGDRRDLICSAASICIVRT